MDPGLFRALELAGMRKRPIFDVVALILLVAAASVLSPVRGARSSGPVSAIWKAISGTVTSPHSEGARG